MDNHRDPVFGDVSWPHSAWFRSNILIDEQGRARGSDGTSRTLTRGQDRALLRALRRDADAVVTGGATVRAEGWHFPPNGYLLVASTGSLPMSTCPRPHDVRVFSFPNSDDSALVSAVTDVVNEIGASRLLCESGTRLLRALVRAQMIDEAFVSVVAQPARVDEEAIARLTLGLGDTHYDIIDRVTDSDVTFLRFLRHSSTP